jgi:hypothetical protein
VGFIFMLLVDQMGGNLHSHAASCKCDGRQLIELQSNLS